ncbi:LysR family transcriptional regulator [Neisseria sp. Ec49-e6-T10]|uniref:LysR family transcriptional regulator n=1 Tax=Neisseria sp. Ec49-e6-T10 TaxID=3140744 RepID=UPI003EB6DB78
MDWNDLKYFSHIAKTGSLTNTALKYGVSISTVARRMSALEDGLGLPLFIRHQTGYTLTDAAVNILERVQTIEHELSALERVTNSMNDYPSGVVRLATPDTIATHIIIPALPKFKALYPDITLELITGVGMVGLAGNEVDIALRLVRPQKGNVTVQKIGIMTSAIYGSHQYLQEHPVNNVLTGHRFVGWDEAHIHLPASEYLFKHVPNMSFTLKTSSLVTQLAAVKASMGLAILPCFFAKTDTDLAQVGQSVLSEAIWLVTHVELKASKRVRAVMDFLIETIGQQIE